jgi:flagellar motor protein MotB
MGKGVVGAAMIATLSLGLGGCNNKEKEQIKMLSADNEALKQQNATLEQGLRDKDSQISSLQSERDTLKAQAAQAQQQAPLTDSGAGGRATRGEGTVITIAGDVLFDSGSTTIKSTAKKELDSVASQLKGKWAGHQIRVEGFTDKTPIKKSKFPSNEALSQARAESVEQYLISKGVSADRISSVGRGSAKLKSTNAASRRVEIVVLGN